MNQAAAPSEHSVRAKYLPVVFVLGLLMYAITAAVNIGFIAIDDYVSGIAPVVPAQKQTASAVIKDSDFRSPIPSLTLLGISRVAYALGVDDPSTQYRVVLIVLAIFSFSMNAFFAYKLFKLSHPADPAYQLVSVGLVGFYFLCPLFMTRSLIEALAAPFLTASGYFACEYFNKRSRSSLVWSVLFLCLASVYRFQAGVCAIALLLIILAARALDIFMAALLGAVFFIATGVLDWAMKGKFHASLISYVKYNIAFSSQFGTPPFYTFLLLFVGLSLPPLFFSRYRNFRWRSEYGPLLPAVLFFSVFVVAHSLVPHKEERFMIPALPLYLILLTPLARYLLKSPSRRWRVPYFLVLNSTLLCFVSFNIPQNNIVGLARFIHRHPSFTKIVGIEDTLVVFPRAFILHPIEEETASPNELGKLNALGCNTVLAARNGIVPNKVLAKDFAKIGEFEPGFLEALAVKLNPRNNARRGPISLFAPRNCRR